MSSETQTTVAPVVVKTKAPSLAAKHTRFMAFGYWFIANNAELVSEELRDQLFRKLNMFATVEEQTAFYEGFEGQLSEVNKTIRKMIAASKKPPKTKAPRAKKTKEAPQDELVAQLIADANNAGVETTEPVVAAEKKPKAPKKTKGAEATGEAAAEKKPKAPRAKKTKEAEPLAEPSPELVSEPITESLAEPVAAEKKPKAPRVKKTKEAAPDATGEDAAEKPVEKKKKVDSEKPKKTKKTKEVVPDSNDRDIQTQFITIDDKEYLIDESNKLYNAEAPHDQVGTYDPETAAVNLF
jgi:hypothetical protein